MHQSRRLKRVPWPLRAEQTGRHHAQLGIDRGDDPAGALRVGLIPVAEEPRDGSLLGRWSFTAQKALLKER